MVYCWAVEVSVGEVIASPVHLQDRMLDAMLDE